MAKELYAIEHSGDGDTDFHDFFKCENQTEHNQSK